MSEWLVIHPRMVRLFSAALVAVGAVAFVRIVQIDRDLAVRIAGRADEARTASEALGG